MTDFELLTDFNMANEICARINFNRNDKSKK